jgi:hypothetical protein
VDDLYLASHLKQDYAHFVNATLDYLKKLLYKMSPKSVRYQYDLNVRTRGTHEVECPICGFRGVFQNFGMPPRLNAQCPNCGSLERHRLFFLFFLLNYKPNDSFIKAKILHFAAEPVLEKILRPIFGTDYQTADLLVEADLNIDIENIQLESNSVQTIICMHVLEHVDDKKSLSEMFRILSQQSFLILAFPIIEGWASTYENDKVTTDQERLIHFGQADHIKYFGRDVRSRILDHGFAIVEELTGSPEMCVKYGLQRGEVLFLCKKP